MGFNGMIDMLWGLFFTAGILMMYFYDRDVDDRIKNCEEDV